MPGGTPVESIKYTEDNNNSDVIDELLGETEREAMHTVSQEQAQQQYAEPPQMYYPPPPQYHMQPEMMYYPPQYQNYPSVFSSKLLDTLKQTFVLFVILLLTNNIPFDYELAYEA